jgi:tetratricopeptide (TPR) repeat protein
MRRSVFLLAICLCLAVPGQSQQGDKDPNRNQPPPRSDRDNEAGESSSRDSRIDLSPPKDDAKDHPNSTVPEADGGDDTAADVQEFHPYDPHRALKDIEVGDFYFKKRNYRAALDRYREALFYKNNDALANFRIAQACEKLNQSDEAVEHYQQYLKVLPNGPLSEEAKKALEKLKASPASGKDQAKE